MQFHEKLLCLLFFVLEMAIGQYFNRISFYPMMLSTVLNIIKVLLAIVNNLFGAS